MMRAVEVTRVRVMFTATERHEVEGWLQFFFEKDGGWAGHKAVQVRDGLVAIVDAEIAAEQPGIESDPDGPIPVTLSRVVDEELRLMGWKRSGDLRILEATQPHFPNQKPNRAAECLVRRGWSERKYLRRSSRVA